MRSDFWRPAVLLRSSSEKPVGTRAQSTLGFVQIFPSAQASPKISFILCNSDARAGQRNVENLLLRFIGGNSVSEASSVVNRFNQLAKGQFAPHYFGVVGQD